MPTVNAKDLSKNSAQCKTIFVFSEFVCGNHLELNLLQTLISCRHL